MAGPGHEITTGQVPAVSVPRTSRVQRSECHLLRKCEILTVTMRVAVALLLPLLGHGRIIAPRNSSPNLKHGHGLSFDNAASVCYVYTTTYLVPVTIGPSSTSTATQGKAARDLLPPQDYAAANRSGTSYYNYGSWKPNYYKHSLWKPGHYEHSTE